MMATARRAFVPLLRQLLAAIVRVQVPAESRLDARHAAAVADPSEAPAVPPTPFYAEAALNQAVNKLVDEFIKAVVQAIDPLAKQYGGVVAQVRPRVIKIRLGLRAQLLEIATLCVLHPEHLLSACRALLEASDRLRAAVLLLEPVLLPLSTSRDEQHAVPAAELPVVLRAAVKQGTVGEMATLAPALAAVLARHEHRAPELEDHLHQAVAGWSERSYTQLLASFTAHCGAELAEGAMPHVAALLPSTGQWLADELTRQARLVRAAAVARAQRTIDAERGVMQCLVQPTAAAHATAIARGVARVVGSALAREIDEIVERSVAAKLKEQMGPEDDGRNRRAQRRRSTSLRRASRRRCRTRRRGRPSRRRGRSPTPLASSSGASCRACSRRSSPGR